MTIPYLNPDIHIKRIPYLLGIYREDCKKKSSCFIQIFVAPKYAVLMIVSGIRNYSRVIIGDNVGRA